MTFCINVTHFQLVTTICCWCLWFPLLFHDRSTDSRANKMTKPGLPRAHYCRSRLCYQNKDLSRDPSSSLHITPSINSAIQFMESKSIIPSLAANSQYHELCIMCHKSIHNIISRHRLSRDSFKNALLCSPWRIFHAFCEGYDLYTRVKSTSASSTAKEKYFCLIYHNTRVIV